MFEALLVERRVKGLLFASAVSLRLQGVRREMVMEILDLEGAEQMMNHVDEAVEIVRREQREK